MTPSKSEEVLFSLMCKFYEYLRLIIDLLDSLGITVQRLDVFLNLVLPDCEH